MRRSVAVLLALAVGLGAVFTALAQPTILNEFTQSEIDTNWEGDRQFPSDGATSVTAFGRDNVLRIGIDSSQVHPTNDFNRTEGIKTVGAGDFGNGVQADLYVDPDWQGKAVRAGLWVVGDDGEGARDEFFGIIEFVNNELCPEPDCSNQPNITEHEGWRIWSSITGWTNVDMPVAYGQWYTLTIELDEETQQYLYSVNGDRIGTAPGGENFIREVFLNSYNYGADNFPTLSSDSYAAHWDNAPAVQATGVTLCANPGNGQVVTPNSGQCPRGFVEIQTPSDDPLTFCVNVFTAMVSYSSTGVCGQHEIRHIVPNNGDLLTCVSIYTGQHRRVSDHDQCNRYEIPHLIPAGAQGAPPSRPAQ